jgi:hypothetical protein
VVSRSDEEWTNISVKHGQFKWGATKISNNNSKIEFRDVRFLDIIEEPDNKFKRL